MRLLFFGDLATTGFGTVTSDLGRALLERDVDVRFVSQNSFAALPEPFFSRTLDLATYSASAEGILEVRDFIPRVLQGEAADMEMADGNAWGDWKPDACLLLGDFYGMRLMALPYLGAFSKVPTYHYCPVEGHDLPALWNDIWRWMHPVAMSKFGQTEIAKVIGHMPPLMYHGVDTTDFWPVSLERPVVIVAEDKTITLTTKAQCKAFFGIHPKAKVVLRTDRLMPRKGYPAMLRAMGAVMETREDVVLMIHCRTFDQGGFLPDLISKMPRAVQGRVLAPNHGSMPRVILCALYNAADVYVSTSAEGFGLTIAEALACGVPAVGLDYSAVPEVIGEAGKVVPVGRLIDNEYGHHWALPDEAQLTNIVGYLLDHPARARELGAYGPKHIARNFTWAAAADVMTGLLEPAQELVAV